MYYGTHAAASAGQALYQLMLATAKRIRAQPMPAGCTVARFPAGLFFVRGDRARRTSADLKSQENIV